MANYRPGTVRMMDCLLEMDEEKYRKMERDICLEKKKNTKNWVVFVDDKEERRLMEMSSDQHRLNTIILTRPLQEGLKKGELAKGCYNICPPLLSMVVNINDAHRPKQDYVISAALLADPPLRPEDVDHALMELELPGLYTEVDVDCVKDKQINLRNYVLSRILEYGQDHPRTWDWWLSFAWAVLDHLGLKQLNGIKYTGKSLSDEEKALAEGWLAKAKETIPTVNYMELRRAWLDAYKKSEDLPEGNKGDVAAVKKIADKVGLVESSVNKQLRADYHCDGTRGNRINVARMAAIMGCQLEEINQMLRQANFAELYPMREEDVERHIVRMTIENGAKAAKSTDGE